LTLTDVSTIAFQNIYFEYQNAAGSTISEVVAVGPWRNIPNGQTIPYTVSWWGVRNVSDKPIGLYPSGRLRIRTTAQSRCQVSSADTSPPDRTIPDCYVEVVGMVKVSSATVSYTGQSPPGTYNYSITITGINPSHSGTLEALKLYSLPGLSVVTNPTCIVAPEAGFSWLGTVKRTGTGPSFTATLTLASTRLDPVGGRKYVSERLTVHYP
jgi:hypothetical protein